MQVLTFLRGDINCTFEQGCGPKPALAVYLKGLELVVALPKDMSARIVHEKSVLPCGPPRTFLKAGENVSYKADHLKDVPHTVFARCLYISKEVVESSTRELLEKLHVCKETGII